MSQEQPPQGWGPPPGGYPPGGYGPPQGYPGYPAQPAPAPKTPWYHSSIVLGVSLFFCWPIGLLLLWTSKTTSTVVKLIATGIFGGLGMLFVIGAASGNKSKPSSATIPAAATMTPEAPRPAAPAAPVAPPNPNVVAFMHSVNEKNTECLQVNASDPADLKAKLAKLKKAKIEGLNVDADKDSVTVAVDKKGNSVNWQRLDTCPSEGLLAECGAELSVYEYAIEPAMDLKNDCISKKAQWKETSLYAPAVAAMPIKISAVDLQSAYEDNEVQADMRFKDRKLKVTGTVANISKDVLNKPYVGLGTSNMFISVLAYGVSEAQVANLHKGDRITITCKGGGMMMQSAVLQDCGQ